MPALRIPSTRRVLIDPAVPPPGSLSVTFGAGLELSELSVLSVAFGTAEGEVAQGEKLLGVPPVDTTGAEADEVLRFDALAGAFKPVSLTVPDPADFGGALVALFGYATSVLDAPEVVALGAFDPTRFAVTGRTTLLTLEAVGRVSSPGLEATLELLDEGDVVVASIAWTETSRVAKSASIDLPEASQLYRARISCTGVTDPFTQYAQLGGAALRISWS